MAVQPNTLVVSGPNFQQIDASTMQVQVTGGTTSDTLANIFGTGLGFTATYTSAATATATTTAFYVVPRPMRIIGAFEIHAVAAGGVSTLTVTHDSGTQAPGTGTVIQTGSFNLNATANTLQTATLAAAAATLLLATGDRLTVVFANAIQSTAGLVVSVSLVLP
jgi:hypothetical protein